MRILIVPLLLCISLQTAAQFNWQSSIDSNGITWKTNGKDSMWSFQKKRAFMIRTGVGIQRSFYTELGISSYASTYSSHKGVSALGYYISGEWTPLIKDNESIYGIKTGVELISSTYAIGMELKYLWSQKNSDFVLTPKFGIGMSHYIIVFYGYNLSTNQNPFVRVGCHQFSLVMNFNRKSFASESKIPNF